ncbi:hypothetical protein [Flavobacterium sp.]|jgi:hypothetical protein|uniref:DUF7208 family protein n=1 Tax=Flavobacterium sp. TaxID=239 RepID=UPI0037C0EA56
METIVPTAAVAYLQTCKLLNKPFTVKANSTLNQKYGVASTELPPTGVYPNLGYIGIGNKGASYELAPGNFMLTRPVPHLARHAALYNMIPFIVRPANDDLSASERANYRLRVPMTTSGGENVIAYYLKPLDLAAVTPDLELRNVNNGVITSTPFSYALSDLSPTPPVISNVNLNNPDGDYLVASAKTIFTLNQAEIVNVMEACTILYGDPGYAAINEVALVTGLDKVIQGVINGVATNYTEVICAQIATFIAQNHTLTSSSTEVKIGLNIGSVDPLLIS